MTSRKVPALIVALAAFIATPADAIVFAGSIAGSTDDGGVGSATLTFNHADGSNVMTVTIDNTSPNLNLNGVDQNSPVLRGFGFLVASNDVLPAISSFTLDGNAKSCVSGPSGCGIVLLNPYYVSAANSGFGSGIFDPPLDYVFQTNSGIEGGIFNQASPGDISGNVFADIGTPFFSGPHITTLTIEFASSFTITEFLGGVVDFHRAGIGGTSNLRAFAEWTTEEEPPTEADEPGALALLAFGGFFALRRSFARPA